MFRLLSKGSPARMITRLLSTKRVKEESLKVPYKCSSLLQPSLSEILGEIKMVPKNCAKKMYGVYVNEEEQDACTEKRCQPRVPRGPLRVPPRQCQEQDPRISEKCTSMINPEKETSSCLKSVDLPSLKGSNSSGTPHHRSMCTKATDDFSYLIPLPDKRQSRIPNSSICNGIRPEDLVTVKKIQSQLHLNSEELPHNEDIIRLSNLLESLNENVSVTLQTDEKLSEDLINGKIIDEKAETPAKLVIIALKHQKASDNADVKILRMDLDSKNIEEIVNVFDKATTEFGANASLQSLLNSGKIVALDEGNETAVDSLKSTDVHCSLTKGFSKDGENKGKHCQPSNQAGTYAGTDDTTEQFECIPGATYADLVELKKIKKSPQMLSPYILERGIHLDFCNLDIKGPSLDVVNCKEDLIPGVSKVGCYKNPEYFCYHNMSYFNAHLDLTLYRLPQPDSTRKPCSPSCSKPCIN